MSVRNLSTDDCEPGKDKADFNMRARGGRKYWHTKGSNHGKYEVFFNSSIPWRGLFLYCPRINETLSRKVLQVYPNIWASCNLRVIRTDNIWQTSKQTKRKDGVIPPCKTSFQTAHEERRETLVTEQRREICYEIKLLLFWRLGMVLVCKSWRNN